MQKDEIKAAIGRFATTLIENNMVVGLGTGSTAIHFIKALAERVKNEKLLIQGIASSKNSHDLAKSLGIPMLDPQNLTTIDLTIDGADEIDPQKRMIKGGGGALVREKILATTSREMVVIVDDSKLVKHLGNFGLPVEIVPFCYKATIAKIESLGFKAKIRQDSHNQIYITDNANYIVDLHGNFEDPARTEKQLSAIAGVVDTGFFIGIAGRVIVGHEDGRVTLQEKL